MGRKRVKPAKNAGSHRKQRILLQEIDASPICFSTGFSTGQQLHVQ
jgi:hypothetical protein